MHPSDAEARGIKDGDIVRVYNERGGVLCGALVWERIMPGVHLHRPRRAGRLHQLLAPRPRRRDQHHRAGGADVEARRRPGDERVPGRGGAGHHGQMEEWKTKYPEAFAREYDPASGLRFNAWVEGREVIMAKKVFVIDIAKCNGCHSCQIVCKDEHVANDWTPIAKPQPEIGQFWIELTERVRGTVPKVKVAYRPHLCMHCDKAPCIDVVRRPGRALQAGRRSRHHRPGEVHRLQELRRRLPLRHHLLQRRPEHRAEVHRLRPPARRAAGPSRAAPTPARPWPSR